MKFYISKMSNRIEDDKIQYFAKSTDGLVSMHDLVGKEIKIHFGGEIECRKCNKSLKKTFGEGFCFQCFSDAPEAAPCIIRPELCEAHLGKGRDVEWEEKHHNQPHYVYLAKSSHIKVGITRVTNLPSRWIDQGASEAMVIAEVPYRQLAGEMEVELKDMYSDKTSWQRMLKNEVSNDDLEDEMDRIETFIGSDLGDYLVDDLDVIKLNYPVIAFPEKVKSLKLDKQPIIEKKLNGIKGQYLIFDDNTVMNWRSHTGYWIDLKVFD